MIHHRLETRDEILIDYYCDIFESEAICLRHEFGELVEGAVIIALEEDGAVGTEAVSIQLLCHDKCADGRLNARTGSGEAA